MLDGCMGKTVRTGIDEGCPVLLFGDEWLSRDAKLKYATEKV